MDFTLQKYLEHEVGVGLAVDVHRVEVVGLDDVDTDQNVQRIVGREALQSVTNFSIYRPASEQSTFEVGPALILFIEKSPSQLQ
jgi:hypothetical protein